MKKDHSVRNRILLALSLFALVCVAVFLVASSLSNTNTAQKEKELEQLELSIRRAAAACYACDGFYPPTLDYLVDRSGIKIDEDRFTVFYEVFAENLMPQITVIPAK